MKYDVSALVMTHKGEELRNGKQPVSYGDLMELLANSVQDKGEERMRAFRVLVKLGNSPEVDLTAEEVALLKKQALDGPLLPLAAGRLVEFLESAKAE